MAKIENKQKPKQSKKYSSLLIWQIVSFFEAGIRVGWERRVLKPAAICPVFKDGPSAVSAPCPSPLNMTRTLFLHHLLPAHLLFLSLTGLTPAYGITTGCSFRRYRIAPGEDERCGGLGRHLCVLGRLRNWEYKTAGRLGIKTFLWSVFKTLLSVIILLLGISAFCNE